jgi:hypothetical protein
MEFSLSKLRLNFKQEKALEKINVQSINFNQFWRPEVLSDPGKEPRQQSGSLPGSDGSIFGSLILKHSPGVKSVVGVWT